ncbi:hypothetical protein ACFLT0_00495 [Chloroflexota bacterium]
MSKRAAGVGHEAPPEYELAGDWDLAAVRGRGLVTLLAGGTCVFGLALILGVVAGGMLQGVGEFHISVGLSSPIFLAIIAAFVSLHGFSVANSNKTTLIYLPV